MGIASAAAYDHGANSARDNVLNNESDDGGSGGSDHTDTSNGKDDAADLSGKLRDAANGKGNFGIGSGAREQSDAMGDAWVGDNPTVASDGRTLVSEDKLRQYRPPSEKPNSDHASTGVQSNFEQRHEPSGQWQSNGHLDITD